MDRTDPRKRWDKEAQDDDTIFARRALPAHALCAAGGSLIFVVSFPQLEPLSSGNQILRNVADGEAGQVLRNFRDDALFDRGRI
jgi:hypothetical protein